MYARDVTKAAKRKKEKDNLDFAFPEFDERAYMGKEVEGAKTAVVCVILAIPVAAALYGLAVVGLGIVAFFLGVALTFSLPRIFQVLEILPWPKVETSKFERRDWFGHGATFFFSWLAFWILLLNAPFVDLTSPVIAVTAWAGGASTIPMASGVTNDVVRNATATATVFFNVTILENVGVDDATITIRGNTSALDHVEGARYSFRYPPMDTTQFNVAVYARDVGGRETTFEFAVQFSS